MATPFLGQVSIVSFNFPPRGFALCNGQLMLISQNAALFSLLGTIYGGNGVSTFALPNLQGRTPIHFGNGLVQGEEGGEVTHTLLPNEMPAHTHGFTATSAAATAASPSGNTLAMASSGVGNAYVSGAANTPLSPNAGGVTGNSGTHDNMQPYLVINFVIALQGIFPSRS